LTLHPWRAELMAMLSVGCFCLLASYGGTQGLTSSDCTGICSPVRTVFGRLIACFAHAENSCVFCATGPLVPGRFDVFRRPALVCSQLVLLLERACDVVWLKGVWCLLIPAQRQGQLLLWRHHASVPAWRVSHSHARTHARNRPDAACDLVPAPAFSYSGYVGQSSCAGCEDVRAWMALRTQTSTQCAGDRAASTALLVFGRLTNSLPASMVFHPLSCFPIVLSPNCALFAHAQPSRQLLHVWNAEPRPVSARPVTNHLRLCGCIPLLLMRRGMSSCGFSFSGDAQWSALCVRRFARSRALVVVRD
jgi:hypothetical protein